MLTYFDLFLCTRRLQGQDAQQKNSRGLEWRLSQKPRTDGWDIVWGSVDPMSGPGLLLLLPLRFHACYGVYKTVYDKVFRKTPKLCLFFGIVHSLLDCSELSRFERNGRPLLRRKPSSFGRTAAKRCWHYWNLLLRRNDSPETVSRETPRFAPAKHRAF